MRFSSPPSFVSVEKPRFSAPKPLLVSSPHSGRHYPEAFLAASCLPAASLRRTEDRLIDWFCDGLSEDGVTVVKTSLPRVWCDVNRGCAEIDERMFRPSPIGRHFERTDKVRAGFGVIPRLASHSIPIYTHCLPLEELDQRLSAGWFPSCGYRARTGVFVPAVQPGRCAIRYALDASSPNFCPVRYCFGGCTWTVV